jgi:hypothetical protein
MTKRGKLGGLAAPKAPSSDATPVTSMSAPEINTEHTDPRRRSPRRRRGSGARIGQTIRLNHSAHRQLSELAERLDCDQHWLLLEAVDMLFERHGLAPIARSE